MDLIWWIFAIFPVFVKAQNLTEVKVGLGQNATLICPLDPEETDISWLMEIHSQIRVPIARTFTEETSEHYLDTSKYRSIGDKLVVTNISTEDFRLYFCARKQRENFIYEKTFLLVSGDLISLNTNQSESSVPRQNDDVTGQSSDVILYISLALNALLISVFIGFGLTCLCDAAASNSEKGTSQPSHGVYEVMERPTASRTFTHPEI